MPNFEFEIKAGSEQRSVAGVDEVGRGCLAGSVVAAAVILPRVRLDSSDAPEWLSRVDDSKKLSESEREELAPRIREWALAWAIGSASVEEIDRINILQASHLAMLRAIEGLKIRAEHLLIDGKLVPKGLPCAATAIVQGDSKSLSIACASIIAKVHRDTEMKTLDAKYPGYGLGVHKGYSTPQHQKALFELGATGIHRRSFAPVRAALERAAHQSAASNSGAIASSAQLKLI